MPSRGEDVDYVAEMEVEDQVEAVEEALENLDLEYQRFPLTNNIESLVKTLKAYNSDVVINLCEGAFGDSHLEMNVPSLLELLRIPYTGSPPLALGLCQDKGLAKDILVANRIPTPKYKILRIFEDWKENICYPLFVKPLREDASIGITKESFVKNNIELKKQVEYSTKCYSQPALVEKYIVGRELNISLLGNEKPNVLPISEIFFEFTDEPKIRDYSSKWLKDSDEYKKTKSICPTKLKSSAKTRVEQISLEVFKALYCRDYARVDIRLMSDKLFVLEINPNPDISPDSSFALSLKIAGITFTEFIRKIITFALERKT